MNKHLAQITNPVLPPSLGQGSIDQGGTALGMLISNIIGAIFIIAVLVALVYLLTGALYWITSSGDKTNLQNARNRIMHAILGLIVVASVWAIMNLLSTFLGIDFVNLPIPTMR